MADLALWSVFPLIKNILAISNHRVLSEVRGAEALQV